MSGYIAIDWNQETSVLSKYQEATVRIYLPYISKFAQNLLISVSFYSSRLNNNYVMHWHTL